MASSLYYRSVDGSLGSHATYISSLSTNSKLYDSRYRGTVIGILLFAYGIRYAYVQMFPPHAEKPLQCARVYGDLLDLL